MITKKNTIIPCFAAAFIVAIGCGPTSENNTVATPAPAPTSAAPAPAAAVIDAATTATEAVKQVAGQAQAVAAAATDKIRELIDSAKKLGGENKWEEALKLLQQAKGMQLSAEQKSMVDGLVSQFQQQMAKAALQKAGDKAGEAVGKSLEGLIKK